MPIQPGRYARLGFARQAVEGVAAVNPTITCGTTGAMLGPTNEMEEVMVARGDLSPEIEAKTIHKVDGGLEMLAVPNSLGYLLLGAFGSVASVASVHTFSFADPLPFLTVFSRVGQTGGDWKNIDCQVDELELAWEAGKELKVKSNIKGKKGDHMPVAFVNVDENEDYHMRYAGATMLLDPALGGGPAVTPIRSIKKGSIKIIRKVELIQTDDITPQFVVATRRGIELSYTQVYEGSDEMRRDLYGTALLSTMTTAGHQPTYGSFAFKFGRDEAHSLTISVPGMHFKVGEFPKSNPGGDVFELEVVGNARLLTGAVLGTAVLKNTQGSYAV